MSSDTLFILDVSGSIGYDNCQKQKTGVINAINKTDVGGGSTRVAVVAFSDFATTICYLNT